MKIEIDVYADGVLQDNIKLNRLAINRKPNSAHEARLSFADNRTEKILSSPNAQSKYFSFKLFVEGFKSKNTPVFEGLIKKLTGTKDKKGIIMQSPINRLMDFDIDVDRIKEFNGAEISSVLLESFLMAEEGFPFISPYFNYSIESTSPTIYFDAGKLGQSTNKTRGAKVRDIVKHCLSLMEKNISENGQTSLYPFGKYILTEYHSPIGTSLVFKRIPSINDASARWFSLDFETDVWELSQQDSKYDERYNDVTVPYADGFIRNSHSGLIKVEGYRSLQFKPPKQLADSESAYRLGLNKIYSNFYPVTGLEVSDPLLIEAYPHLSVVNIINAPSVRDDVNFLITKLNLDVGNAGIKIISTLSSRPKTLTEITGIGSITSTYDDNIPINLSS